MKSCPKCGNKVIEGLKYCFTCGADIDEKVVKQASTKTVKKEEKKCKAKSRLSSEVFEHFMN